MLNVELPVSVNRQHQYSRHASGKGKKVQRKKKQKKKKNAALGVLGWKNISTCVETQKETARMLRKSRPRPRESQ